ncbi:MAG: hypothetical protein AAF441_19695 [Pseudomonadota bacterium]
MIRTGTAFTLLATALVTTGILAWYFGFHLERMAPYPLKAKGAYAYVMSAIVGFRVASFLRMLWAEREELLRLFKLTPGRISACLIVTLPTPIANLMWIPIPVAALLVLSRSADYAAFVTFALAVPAYAVACLAAAQTSSVWRMIGTVLLYLVAALAAVTLFSGVSYI